MKEMKRSEICQDLILLRQIALQGRNVIQKKENLISSENSPEVYEGVSKSVRTGRLE
jgi:hypothetical protein